jgi:hypothetical protein
MGWLEDKVEKWGRKIREFGGAAKSEKVLEGHEGLAEATPEGRAEWSRRAMERLAEVLPDEAARAEIMGARACVFAEEFGEEPLLELRAIYRKDGLEAVFEAMERDREKHSRPYLEGNIIYETKAPREPEVMEAASTAEEKRAAYCHCPLARAGAGTAPVAQPYCCCGGGWYDGIWKFILERPVRVETVRSVMSGDDCCTFAVHLPPDAVKP